VVVGDFISSDSVLRGKYTFLPPDEIVKHVLEDEGPELNATLRRSRTLVAGAGFGYGSGRESPARALKSLGIELMIAPSFGRMFYRNAINQGIFAIECADIGRWPLRTGDEVFADVEAGLLRWKDETLPMGSIPPFIVDIVQAGGLVQYSRIGRAGTA
jgi:3-isopropylmalate/(R)-2-methylmalate dehydratase small subunit